MGDPVADRPRLDGVAARASVRDRDTLALSIVVPVRDEQDNVEPLTARVKAALGPATDWELILVDDGSTDETVRRAARLAAADNRVRLLRLTRNFGQTAAMQAGFDHARGGVIVSMDGDLQNDPADIPRLLEKLEDGYDLVTGYRERRQDRLITRRVPSWIANRIIRWMTGVPVRDNGCSLKAYRAELLRRLNLYSDMHRFIPALAAAVGGARIAEVPVRHHPRRYGASKYGLARVAKVLADLMTIEMIRWFRDRPLLMFGGGALVAGLLGAAAGFAAAVVHLTGGGAGADAFVFPGVALIWFGLCCYLIMIGLIAEVVLRRRMRRSRHGRPLVKEVAWERWPT